MQMKEVEVLTGLTGKNIRFYEKAGLLTPRRNASNSYRQYSDEDVKRLKTIKLLRKLDIGIKDIKDMLDGDLELNECMTIYLPCYVRRKEELEKTIELCTKIQAEKTSLQDLDTNFYLKEVAAAERRGARFKDIARDFANKARGILPVHAKLFFEPREPVMNQWDFKKELERYAEQEEKSLTFISLGMRPKILLDGTVYSCALEMPRLFYFPFSIFFAAQFNFGYRWIYLYEMIGYEW
ncbi:MAG: MerR family transcriptional regulator [Oscillospiraceae bacterium]|nr:MerR family transcriptional regulator [Oscillospiraceae bacterium]